MRTPEKPARRQLGWPDVTGLAVVGLFVLGLAALAVMCAGRWPW